jgi:hypothetical protein
MTTAQIIVLALSSSVLAAALSVAGSHVLAALQFRREYHKEIIRRRLTAYESVDRLVAKLRLVTYDNQGRLAHVVFAAGRQANLDALAAATDVLSEALYVSDEVRDALLKVNVELLGLSEDASAQEAFDVGVQKYEALSTMRQHLEALVARDLMTLHEIDRFLRLRQRSLSGEVQRQLHMLPKNKGEA